MKHGPPGKSGLQRWNQKNRVQEGFSFSRVGKGVVFALILALLLTLLASATVHFTKLDEGTLYWFVNIGSFIVLGFASFVTARMARSHGLFYGLAIGGAYAILTSLFGALIYPPFIGITVVLKRLGFSLLAGACGGILGVNY
ncbi:MAG TPA: TIGR04086 family membrane protein [Firmicutes bacterium]|jgi:putative membrane protein (TIGR04086 family)|nr:TIGR04086 family membrane protein [Bacillota bacterium]